MAKVITFKESDIFVVMTVNYRQADGSNTINFFNRNDVFHKTNDRMTGLSLDSYDVRNLVVHNILTFDTYV